MSRGERTDVGVLLHGAGVHGTPGGFACYFVVQ